MFKDNFSDTCLCKKNNSERCDVHIIVHVYYLRCKMFTYIYCSLSIIIVNLLRKKYGSLLFFLKKDHF